MKRLLATTTTFIASFSPSLRWVSTARAFSIRSELIAGTREGLRLPRLATGPATASTKARAAQHETRLFLSIDPKGDNNSVSGVVYTAEGADYPVVQLYTKAGCTLCETARAVLEASRPTWPHTLVQVDITDPDQSEYYERYKYDIPVFHINEQYWTKHRLTSETVESCLAQVRDGTFSSPVHDQPDAGLYERKG